jgi:hypothetical protein
MPAVKTPVRTATKRGTPRKTARNRPAAAPGAAGPSATIKGGNPPELPNQVKPFTEVKASKQPKPREKPVRDSFTMPKADFSLIATLKARTLSAKRETKKSELLRAGLHALAALDTGALMAALGELEPVKIGRPKSGR